MAIKIERPIKEKKRTERPFYTPRVPALEQACRVLLCLEKALNRGWLWRKYPKKSEFIRAKYSILNVLEQFGLVEKKPETKAYSLGWGFAYAVIAKGRTLRPEGMEDIVVPLLHRGGTAIFRSGFLIRTIRMWSESYTMVWLSSRNNRLRPC